MPYTACKCRPHGSKVMEYLRKLTTTKAKPESWEAYIRSKNCPQDIVKEINTTVGRQSEIILNSTQKSHKFNVSKAEIPRRSAQGSIIQSEPQLHRISCYFIRYKANRKTKPRILRSFGWLNLSQQRMNKS